MGSILDKPVLFLNKNWSPIHIGSVRDAMTTGYIGAAQFIDHEDTTYPLFSMNEWMKMNVKEHHDFVKTNRQNIRAPKIMVLTEFGRVFNFEVKLTSKNLLTRDRRVCQYSGRRLPINQLDIDHVIPRARGGKHEWTNVVLADRAINKRKRDLSVREAGLTLIRKPFKPRWSPLFTRTVRRIPSEWEPFLSMEDRNKYLALDTDPVFSDMENGNGNGDDQENTF